MICIYIYIYIFFYIQNFSFADLFLFICIDTQPFVFYPTAFEDFLGIDFTNGVNAGVPLEPTT